MISRAPRAAGPTPINFNELHSALQTKLVESDENLLPIIATAKLYEVHQDCSTTNHVWDGYWVLSNRRPFQRLPKVRPAPGSAGRSTKKRDCRRHALASAFERLHRGRDR